MVGGSDLPLAGMLAAGLVVACIVVAPVAPLGAPPELGLVAGPRICLEPGQEGFGLLWVDQATRWMSQGVVAMAGAVPAPVPASPLGSPPRTPSYRHSLGAHRFTYMCGRLAVTQVRLMSSPYQTVRILPNPSSATGCICAQSTEQSCSVSGLSIPSTYICGSEAD